MAEFLKSFVYNESIFVQTKGDIGLQLNSADELGFYMDIISAG
jgi:hypothetical protein